MQKSKLKPLAGVFGALLALSVVFIVLDIFGLSVCLFGRPLHAFLALPFLAGAIGLTVCLVLWLKRRKKAGDRLLQTALQIVLCTLCALAGLAAVFGALLTHTPYAAGDVADDGAHKAFLETEADAGEPVVHVYKRYGPFFLSYRNAGTLYGFYGEESEIEYLWYPTYCEVQYPGFADDAQSDSERTSLTRKIYFNVS